MLQNDCINKMSCLHLYPFQLNKGVVLAALTPPPHHDGLQWRLLSSSGRLTPPLWFYRSTSLLPNTVKKSFYSFTVDSSNAGEDADEDQLRGAEAAGL